jgi:hypothetical protein
MVAYVGVTAHWITEQWELRSEVVSFHGLSGPHTGETVGGHLYGVVKTHIGGEKVGAPTCVSTCVPSF